MSLRIKTELWQQKSAFLLLTQFAVFSIALFYLCRAIFPIDFSGIDALFGGFDTGILWATGSLLFIGLLKAREDIAGKIVYIGLPAAFFLLFSLLIHGFASMGIWFFAVLISFAYLIWFVQTLITSWKPGFLILLVPINFLVTLFVYIDYVHYSLTREHLNLIYLRIIRAVGGTFFEALMKAGITPLMLLLPIVCAILLLALIFPILHFGPRLDCGKRRSYAVALSLLFLPLYFQFSLLAPEIPVSEYLNFKMHNFWFPLPHVADFESGASAEITGLLANAHVSDADFSRQAEFAWLSERKDKNLVFLVVESLRQDYLMHSMPETRKLAEDGILCRNHLSNANETEGSLIALYYGTLPLVSQRSLYDTKSSAWIDFMKGSGYDFIRFNCSQGNLFFPDYSYVNFKDYLRGNKVAVPENTTLDENSRLICDTVIHKLKNSEKKCVIEAYLFHTHYKFFYPENFEKFTPVLHDNSEILSRGFEEAAQKLTNRYRNAILYTDHLISEFVKRLKSEGLLDDTLLVIIGDHGEMLGEDGKLFHASGGGILQYQTPFILLGKDVPKVAVSKVTSHIDIVPTLGRQMGFSVTSGLGNDVLSKTDKGAVTFDIAGPDRLIYRDQNFSSLFHWSGRLNWVLTSDSHFRFDDSFAALYRPENLPATLQRAADHCKGLLSIIQKK